MKIGLEVHVQLPTRSKMFCSCPTTDAPAPNTHVCPVCLGMPGSRPVLNRQVLVYGIMLAKMLGCTVADTTWFSRKIYFYPDMSKSVQITQYDHPVGVKGAFRMASGKVIRITRIHLEEDPGKTKRTADMTALVDYNRSGVPLAEIVTEPDISSPKEAREFLTELVADIRHTIDLPDDGERSIRCDCNISVGKERCEVKNVTGMKNAERALTYEMVRQIKILKAGGKIERETRNFDEDRGITYSARKKEMEADYGYIDEPDLGIYHIGEMARNIRISESPTKMASRLASQYGLTDKMARQLVSTSTDLAAFFEQAAGRFGKDAAVKWVAGPVSAGWKALEERKADPAPVLDIIERFQKGEITDTEAAIEIRTAMTGESAESAAAASADLDRLVSDYLDANPQIVADYRKSEKAANRAIGYVMKSSGGAYSSADIVAAVKRLIQERLRMGDTTVLVLAHGSDVAGTRNVAQEQAAYISAKLGLPAYGATLRMQEPKVEEVLPRMCRECDPDRIVVVPLLFSEGYYTRKVIPQRLGIPEGSAVAGAEICGREREVAIAEVFASHPAFPKVLNRILRAYGERGRLAALVITHGTPDGSGNALAEECAKAFTDRHVPAVAAYNEFQQPGVEKALASLVDGSPMTDVVVAIPLFISPSNHSRNEIPEKLGVKDGSGTYERNGRTVKVVYADEVGMQPAVGDILVDRVLEAEKRMSQRSFFRGLAVFDGGLGERRGRTFMGIVAEHSTQSEFREREEARTSDHRILNPRTGPDS